MKFRRKERCQTFHGSYLDEQTQDIKIKDGGQCKNEAGVSFQDGKEIVRVCTRHADVWKKLNPDIEVFVDDRDVDQAISSILNTVQKKK